MLAQIDEHLNAAGHGTEAAVKAMGNLNALWEVMCPAERYSLIHAVVRQITIFKDHIKVGFNRDGLATLLTEAGMEGTHEQN